MTYVVDKQKVLYPDECFQINGVCFYVQKRLGRFAKEKQYKDAAVERFTELRIPCIRQRVVGRTGNRTDLIVFNKILLELKAIPFLSEEDYNQVKRYLDVWI